MKKSRIVISSTPEKDDQNSDNDSEDNSEKSYDSYNEKEVAKYRVYTSRLVYVLVHQLRS